ncbi:hypothetical protein HYPSUDRAFT_202972 [Hypholoma sublateritium FD-334 SS-4]|uniref:Uncharacterized protein n=1 Tax=Hypholoma sublateritium (strain FD-334 SS-4) TaxID=945553 RepID=A0A0D2NRK5_HYPSF|nr:hypothetical protein HYPSUDRAFT_202972 [Hypholoma sublateritium FD-334 SS-4]
MIIPFWGSLTSGGSISAAALAITTSFLALGGGDAHENKGRTPTITGIAGGASIVAAAVPAIALGYEIFTLRRNVPLGATPHHKPSRPCHGRYIYTRTTGSSAGAPRGGNGALCAMAMCAAAGMAGVGLVGSGAGQGDSEAPGIPQDDSFDDEYDTDNSIGEETGGAGDQGPSSGGEQNEADDSDMVQDEEDDDAIFEYQTGGGGGSPPPAPSGTNSSIDNNGGKNFYFYFLNCILAIAFAIAAAFKKIGARRSAAQVERSFASSAVKNTASRDNDIVAREPDTLVYLLDNGLQGLSNLVVALELVPLHDPTQLAPMDNKHSKTSPAFLENISPQTIPLPNILDMCLVGSAPDSLDNTYFDYPDNSTNDTPGIIEVYLPPSAQEAMQRFAQPVENARIGWITYPLIDFAVGISLLALYYGRQNLGATFQRVRHWAGVVTASLFIVPAETPASQDDLANSVLRLDIDESVTLAVADEINASTTVPQEADPTASTPSTLVALNAPNMSRDAQDVDDEIARPTSVDSMEPITPITDASQDVHKIDDECPSEPMTAFEVTPSFTEPNAASSEQNDLQDIIAEPATAAIDECCMELFPTAASDVLQDEVDNEITAATPNVNYIATEVTIADNAAMAGTPQEEQEAANNIDELAPTDTTATTDALQRKQEVDIDLEESAGLVTVVEELPISLETEPGAADINPMEHDDEDDPNYEFHYPASTETSLSEIVASQALLALVKQGVQQATSDVVQEFAVQTAPEVVEQAFAPVGLNPIKDIIREIFAEIVERTDRLASLAAADEVVEQQPGAAASGMDFGSSKQAPSTYNQLHPQASAEGDDSGLGVSIHAPSNFFGRPKRMLPRRAKVDRVKVKQSVVTEQPEPAIFNFNFGKDVGSVERRAPSEASEDVIVAQQRSQSPTESGGSGLEDSIHAPSKVEDRRVKGLPRRRVRAARVQIADNINTEERPRLAVSVESVEAVEIVEVATRTDMKDDTSVDQQRRRTPVEAGESGLGESIHAPCNIEDKSLPHRVEAVSTATEKLEATPSPEAGLSAIPVYTTATASKPPSDKRSKKRRGRRNH